jgi:glycosyltransferase involved in cell wall biosynthesis
MSNTINYQTEYAAVRSCQWKTIVVPSRHFGKLVRKIRPDVRVRVVPYGISARDLTLAKSIFPAKWPTYGATVRLPHRPDSRKGHREAIEGLSNALPASSNLVLEISWLEETRYEMYKRELKELANTLGVSNQVRFIPWVKTYDKWRNANRCVATLQLGVFEETFGLSLVESILIGRPVFTCCQPAVREVVGNSALLIELKEPQNWYTKFEEFWEKHNPDFVSDPERQRLLYASLQIERMAADYNKILRNTNVI